MNKKRLVILLLIISLAYSRTEQEPMRQFLGARSEDQDSNNEVVAQIISYFRHAAHIDKAMYSKDEYDDYGMKFPFFNLPTYLGNAQSWSYGYYLRQKYPTFFENLQSTETFFALADLVKSYENAKHISSGYMGNYPDWDYTALNDTVINAIKTNGNCAGCPEDTYFPIDDLINGLVTNISDSDVSRDNIHYGDWFIDIDFICQEFTDRQDSIFHELYTYYLVDNELEDDYLEYRNSIVVSSSLNRGSENQFHIPLWSVYYNHQLHGLDEIVIEQESLADIISADKYKEFQLSFFSKLFGEALQWAKLLDTELIRRTRQHLVAYSDASIDDVKKLITLIIHDDNLAALYTLLTKKYPEEFVYHASSLLLEIYYLEDEITDVPIYYVRAYYNDQEIEIRACADLVNEIGRCTLSRFSTILKYLKAKPIKFCTINEQGNQNVCFYVTNKSLTLNVSQNFRNSKYAINQKKNFLI